MTHDIDLIKKKIKESMTSQGVDLDLLSINQRLKRLQNTSKSQQKIAKIFVLCMFILGCLNVPAHEQTSKVEGKVVSAIYTSEDPAVSKLKINKDKLKLKNKLFMSPYKKERIEVTETIYGTPYKNQKRKNQEIKSPVAEKIKSDFRPTSARLKIKKSKFSLNLQKLLEGEYPITSNYGYRKDPVRRRKFKLSIHQHHNGIDIGCPIGTPLHSPAEGYVARVDRKSCSGGGKKIYLDHYNRYQTVYMHLSKIIIQEGQYVSKGQLIGYTGMSGFRVTGPHLHLEVKRDGKHLNPRCFLEN